MGGRSKYVALAVVVVFSLVADQASKEWASSRLANPTGAPTLIQGPHVFQIHVSEDAKGTTVEDFLGEDLVGTPISEVHEIAGRWTLVNGKRASPRSKLMGGEVLTIESRRVTVLREFFHFRYTRNPGAAFGLLANDRTDFRRPFFIGVSLLAIGVIAWIFWRSQEALLLASLMCILGGAMGNLIDRIGHGWVVDFIDWHYHRAYTWPTFNIADVFISVGVALMALEILLGLRRKSPKTDLSE